MRYLLDTTAVSDLVRQPAGLVAGGVAQVGESEVCTSIIVAAELRCGAKKRNSPKLQQQLEAVLGALTVLPLDRPADERYAELRCMLEERGTPIGGNDMVIAAQGLSLNLAVVTDNTREFSRVPGLAVENWQR